MFSHAELVMRETRREEERAKIRQQRLRRLRAGIKVLNDKRLAALETIVSALVEQQQSD